MKPAAKIATTVANTAVGFPRADNNGISSPVSDGRAEEEQDTSGLLPICSEMQSDEQNQHGKDRHSHGSLPGILQSRTYSTCGVSISVFKYWVLNTWVTRVVCV